MTETETTLGDYLQLFWNHRRGMGAVMLGALVLALLLIWLGPKVYEQEKILQIGQVATFPAEGQKPCYEKQLLEDPGRLKERLTGIYKFKQVQIQPSSPYVVITLREFRPAALAAGLALLKEALEPHDVLYRRYQEDWTQRRELLRQRIAELEAEVQSLERQGGGAVHPMTGKFLLFERRDLLWQTKADVERLQRLEDDPDIGPTRFVDMDDTPRLDWRWPVMLVAVWFGLGVLASVLIVLVRENSRPR